MPHIATVRAPSNIAFIKYWGARDIERAIPINPSLSMTLRTCYSRSTVEWVAAEGAHEVLWRGGGGDLETAPPAFADRVRRHLDFLRRWSKAGGHFRVATENSFPAAAGLASSASGFAALTLAVLGALDRRLPVEERSNLARLSGSGSASRSIEGGYVEWPAQGHLSPVASSSDCFAQQIAPPEHWDLRDVIAVVATGPKQVSSLEGHLRAQTSPYFRTRQRRLPSRLKKVRTAIRKRDFKTLGAAVETEAIDLHCIAMTSEPAIFYWQPETLTILAAVREMRDDGVAAYSTMDAGANVHVLCEPDSEDEVAARLTALGLDELTLIHDGVGPGPVAEDEHLL